MIFGGFAGAIVAAASETAVANLTKDLVTVISKSDPSTTTAAATTTTTMAKISPTIDILVNWTNELIATLSSNEFLLTQTAPQPQFIALGVVTSLLMLNYSLKTIATYLQEYAFKSFISVFMSSIRSKLHNHILAQRVSFFHAHKPSDLTSRLSNDVLSLHKGLRSLSSDLILAPLRILFLSALLVKGSPLVAVLAIGTMPLSSLIVVNKLGALIRRREAKVQKHVARLVSKLSESLAHMPFVVSYGLHNHVRDRFESTHNRLLKNQILAGKFDSIMGPASEFSFSIAMCLVSLVGGYQVLHGALSPGELISFLTAMNMLNKPMKKMLSINAELQTCLAASDRIFEIIHSTHAGDAAAESSLIDPKITLPTTPFPIDLQNVYFYYTDGIPQNHQQQSNQQQHVKYNLNNVSLSIRPSEFVLFVGKSGSGKSTILNVISRLQTPQQGLVLLNGLDVRTIPSSQLSSRIAFVHQRPVVWSDSLANNMRLGKLDATAEEIHEALRKASADVFVNELEGGLDAHMGKKLLSIGQQQRLSLARALLTNAPVLLMDEVTSSLDYANEQAIYRTLLKLKGQCTILMVAHRLWIAPYADKVVVMKEGQIVETGTHFELLNGTPSVGTGELYKSLQENQQEEQQHSQQQQQPPKK